MASRQKSVGFCGLGAMGMGMATHLVKQGYAVYGFDVADQNLAKFAAAGGTSAKSLRESAQGQHHYIVMVANMVQAQEVLFDGEGCIAKALPNGATLLLCSTVPSTFAQSVAEQLKSIGRDDIFFVDAPVSGGATRSAAGTLSIMAGASDAAMERGRLLLDEMSDSGKLYTVAGGIGQGSNMKMVHQVLAAIQILATSEALGFAECLGLDLDRVRDSVIASRARSWMFESRSGRAVRSTWTPPESALTIILKDTSIITDTARTFDFPVPLCTVAEQVYFEGLRRGWGAEDDSGMVRWYFDRSNRTPDSKLGVEEQRNLTQLIVLMLEAIHLCAAAEATAFARFMDIPLSQFAELVNNAAGSSVVFKEFHDRLRAQDVKNPSTTLGGHTIAETTRNLRVVLSKAQAIKCPLPLASATINLLLLAQRQGGTGRHAADVMSIWA